MLMGPMDVTKGVSRQDKNSVQPPLQQGMNEIVKWDGHLDKCYLLCFGGSLASRLQYFYQIARLESDCKVPNMLQECSQIARLQSDCQEEGF